MEDGESVSATEEAQLHAAASVDSSCARVSQQTSELE